MMKLLFVLPYYKIGGTLTSFSNLIPLIDKKKYEISAFSLTNDVDDIAILPKGVNYLGLETGTSRNVFKRRGLKQTIINYLKIVKRLLTKLGYDPSEIVFNKMAKSLSGKYDVVIAFQEGQATRMAQYISAPQKIAWVHCMYNRFKSLSNKTDIDAYNRYDKIVCVSYTAAKEMTNSEPQWREKIHVVYNAIDTIQINEKAAECIKLEKKINLVSIGRIDPVKRFSFIPKIAFQLKKMGLDFDWWIIGGVAVQNEYDKIVREIKQLKVDDCVHLLGSLSNPYPFIKSSDLLVCLSSSETFNYTIAEAKAIGVPVVTSDFPCALEFVEHEKTGLIMPIEKMVDGIKRILEDKKLYSDIHAYLISTRNQKMLTKKQFETLLER